VKKESLGKIFLDFLTILKHAVRKTGYRGQLIEIIFIRTKNEG